MARALPFVAVALTLHVVGGLALDPLLPYFAPDTPEPSPPVRLVVVQPPEEEEPEEPEEEEPDWEGQLVETPKPPEEEVPEEAEYLAEHDADVEEETRSERYKINPEVLTPKYSEEEKLEQEDLVDLDMTKPSTGAQVGNERFDPDRDGSMAALPSRWRFTNREGPQDPVPAASTTSAIAGAPQNDLLDEKVGEETALRTKEFLYASYLLRIRRLVNFYWNQNLQNLPSSVRLVKPRYNTGVEATLDANGALEGIVVVTASGSSELDDAVTRAFHLAAPFPHPPEGLISPDGRVHLPEMGFTVEIGQADNRYQGIDPRAGVQFPGLLKSPR